MSRVIVVGGGPAGLVAAYRLKKQGLAVTLLERDTRVGGRVKSLVSPQGYPVNLGAQFIVGADSPAGRLASEMGIELLPMSGRAVASFADGGWTVGANQAEYGAKLKWPLAAKASILWRGTKYAYLAGKMRKAAAEGRYTALHSRLDNRPFSEEIRSAHPEVRDLYSFAVRDFTSHEPEEISSVQGIICADIMSRLELYVAAEGNEQIYSRLRQRLADEVVTGAYVETISETDGEVEISYRCGAAQKKLSADYAVVATSADLIAEMIPQLPQDKRQALGLVSYGCFVTVAFLTNETGAQSWDTLTNILVHDRCPINAVINQTFPFRNREETRAPGSVLVTIAASKKAQQLHAMTDEAIAEVQSEAMLKMFPALRGKIADVIVQKWQRGIPAMLPGAYGKLQTLRAPFGRVYFAGDYHTEAEPKMDPAIVSAERAASEVIARLAGR